MRANNRPLVLVTLPRKIGAAEAAARIGDVIVWPEVGDKAAFLAERAPEIRAIVSASTIPFPGSLDLFSGLELLVFMGAGYATPETQACRDRGIVVCNGPATNHLDVADLAVGLTISAIRGIGRGDRLIRAGEWHGLSPVPMAPSLRDLRYGVVGLGAIGTAIAERLTAFGGDVRWWGPRAKPEQRWRRVDTLLDLARSVDVLVVAARADEGSRHLIDAGILATLGAKGYLVNVSRGLVVDEDALVAALRDGRLAGAGLDVFAHEPTDPASWAGLENVVLSPHLGGWAHASITAQQEMIAENLRRFFAGEPVLTPIPD